MSAPILSNLQKQMYILETNNNILDTLLPAFDVIINGDKNHQQGNQANNMSTNIIQGHTIKRQQKTTEAR